MKRYFSLFFLVVMICVMGCSPVMEKTVTPVSVVTASTESSPTQSPSATTINIQKPILIETFDVSSIYPFYYWWAVDSSKLYYERENIWAFDMGAGNSVESEETRTENPKCDYLPDISNGTIRYQQNHSPQQRKIVYLTLQEPAPQAPTSTPLPPNCLEGICPSYDMGSPVDVWIWENGNSWKVGQMISCVKDFVWAEDEQKLLAIGYDSRIYPTSFACERSNYAWLIDLPNNQIMPLLSKTEHLGEVFVLAYSPDGNSLLFTENGDLNLLDVSTQVTTDLRVSRKVKSTWWINDHQILILFNLSVSDYNMGWSILDLGSGKYSELLNDSNSIGDYIFVEPKISPDEKWLAFTAYYPGEGKFGLWMVRLEVE